MTSQDIRKTFLEFFKSKKHSIVTSAPMVIKDDPTLMFTNAGMNQFKEFFLGNGDPKSSRVTDTQKCLRVSGKHNDLEEVGIDTYHHTMFEMLGNWSFGDYFKEEAIAWAWELLTEVYKVNKDNLYVTIFEGDASESLERDTEAYDFWKNHISEDRILNGNKKDNFWEMGAQGPCGPCSEIHVDLRSKEEKDKVSGAELVNEDHPQVVEIWNLVFMQFNRKADGSLEKLPAQHVDTGMGFERLCMVLQDKTSNYDTDAFTPLIKEIETITATTYGSSEKTDIAIRVISDHVRAVAFSIADGQLPSNTGAGYVIRRILRRGIRYGFTFLNTKEPFIYKLVKTLTKQMGDAYPELVKQENLIYNVIKEEESSFLRTLDQGLVLLDNIIEKSKSKEISGKKAFELYDTYGFPIDLTSLILRERGFSLNEAEFDAELKKQRDRSREATKTETGDWVTLIDDAEQEFIGYDHLEAQVKLTRYRKVENKKDGEMYQLVFNLTPFYAEGGGQVGDKGYLESPDGDVVYIVDTKKENNLVVHFTKNLPKHPEATFKAVVDSKQRMRSASNHTATHLLHQALRSVLGTHVEQKGSMVHSGNLRFDFSHFSKVSAEELTQVEDFVNARIREQLPLEEQRNIPHQKALDEGAIALFGEKYGDAVRTIRFGKSMELCGGTHVNNTSEIRHFKIISEGAVASGIRRIEAISNDAVDTYYAKQNQILEDVKSILKNPQDTVKAVSSLQEENSELKKQVEQLLKDKAKHLKAELKQELETINGINVLAKEIDLDAGSMKDLAFEIGGEVDNLFLVFGSNHNGKALLSCYISKNLVAEKDLNAGKIIRDLGKHIQGGGGGQPFFATAGGKKPDGISAALQASKDIIK
ncbi:alanine--tRNA ligase [Croceibacter atlanticus]|mgnify:FL=1|jgi:alanyl-tRNA synthetase|uniref:Alanine--tRNA ligase n=1 Tax=Croceibacter atlanticus (strain ATCC BAA-628 / JCM 21780 / CIP 108009 / IAM 15332 / KCTC 12090 / HTCC2559) TaxID=216432 RepID=A3U723_CROAH|nr:alanine--tRNA ligase [Croceibacter atlanticus]EAP88040.1 alanyl-tRNA synthetase [Croceibacter atlanticus HTCC2559]MBW4969753.1 alanine--tRNA ligase [Croceibacter atlanticus]